jgi:hypothetical protein
VGRVKSPTTSTCAGQSEHLGTKEGDHMWEIGTLRSISKDSPPSPIPRAGSLRICQQKKGELGRDGRRDLSSEVIDHVAEPHPHELVD